MRVGLDLGGRLRATFQMRTSSSAPLKKPAAAPVEVIAVPMPACWMLVISRREVAAGASVRSRLPSRYRLQVSVAVRRSPRRGARRYC